MLTLSSGFLLLGHPVDRLEITLHTHTHTLGHDKTTKEKLLQCETKTLLFLRMRTKEIVKTAKMYTDRRVIPLLQEMGVAEANGEVRFLTGSS